MRKNSKELARMLAKILCEYRTVQTGTILKKCMDIEFLKNNLSKHTLYGQIIAGKSYINTGKIVRLLNKGLKEEIDKILKKQNVTENIHNTALEEFEEHKRKEKMAVKKVTDYNKLYDELEENFNRVRIQMAEKFEKVKEQFEKEESTYNRKVVTLMHVYHEELLRLKQLEANEIKEQLLCTQLPNA